MTKLQLHDLEDWIEFQIDILINSSKFYNDSQEKQIV